MVALQMIAYRHTMRPGGLEEMPFRNRPVAGVARTGPEAGPATQAQTSDELVLFPRRPKRAIEQRDELAQLPFAGVLVGCRRDGRRLLMRGLGGRMAAVKTRRRGDPVAEGCRRAQREPPA
ncbi:hypothetical protein [Nocardia sp. NPDC019304]|uniref:hypothetical protein n=1 Tax=unclassified Nocardia TaxID=2637762 RepID=UPI0033D3EE81